MLPALLLALSPAAPVSGAADEFRERLSALASPRAAERTAAERWLETNLVLERYAELVESALAGDAEVRGRLVRVLGSDERHFALALELCGERDAGLVALGREAVRTSVARAAPELARPGLREKQGLELLLRAAAMRSPPRLLRLDGRAALEELADQLELVGELPLGLTLDARVATRTIRRAEELDSGPWDELLLRLARGMGVGLECHGLAPERPGETPPGAFLLLVPESEPARTGIERLSEWLFTLAAPRVAGQGEAARTRAALALASSGFAPALEWMDRRFATEADPAAREGLLRAAALGRAAPSLLAAPVPETLLDEAVGAPGPRSARILLALAHLGCFDAHGGALAPRFLAGFAAAAPRAQWARLTVLERGGCAAGAAEAPVRALLSAPGTSPALRLRALFFLATLAGPAGFEPPRVVGLEAFFPLGLEASELQRLGRVLALFGLEPPFRDPAAIPREWSARARLDLLEAWLWRAEPEPVAAHLAAWFADPTPAHDELLAGELRPWLARGARSRLAAAFASARERVPARAAALERVRLLLGLVPGAEVAGVLDARRFALQGAGADLALLGALAGYPIEIEAETGARAELIARLTAAAQENRPLAENRALLAALELAVQGLYAAGRDGPGEDLMSAAQRSVGRSQASELGKILQHPLWPIGPGTEVRDLGRELARFQVPTP